MMPEERSEKQRQQDSLKGKIRRLAGESAIDELRFIDADPFAPLDTYAGRQPGDLLLGARSIIIAGIYIGAFTLPGWDDGNHAMTSRLTLSGFYFNVVDPLVPIQEYLIGKGYRAIVADGFNESACIPLKPAAERAGLGWIGKNTLLLNEKYGSWLAIGAIITDADLAEINPRVEPRCGSCTNCMAVCPMGALEKPAELNRQRCLSHLLEEDEAPESALAASGTYIVECDLCQNSCPWNSQHRIKPLETARGKSFTGNSALLELLHFDSLMAMSEADYQRQILPNFSGITLSYKAFRRNLQAAYSRRQSSG